MTKNIFTVNAGLPFADVVAQWVLDTHGGNSSPSLQKMLILVPSRRGCMALREAFLRVTCGKPLLLPRIQPVGDVDADTLLTLPLPADRVTRMMPTPGFALRRQFILARLLQAHQSAAKGKADRLDHALQQAGDIAELLDQVEREQGALHAIATLVPDDFAAHWQHTTSFLTVVSEHWPAIAAEKHLVSPEQWRNFALGQLAEKWQVEPPGFPVIAAGTTGSIPATAKLLSVIASLPQGAVILPGLDLQADDEYTRQVDPAHFQHGLLDLLRSMECPREDVKPLAAVPQTLALRNRMLSQALCPAAAMHQWQALPAGMAQAAEGLSMITAADEQEEAALIAMLLRESLETPGKTAALVTPDRGLARQVATQMQRFGVQVDDSAGQPLATTPTGALLRLLLEVAAPDSSSHALLALLKHPLVNMGMERIACLEAARELEIRLLRGLCPAEGITGLRAVAASLDTPLSDPAAGLLEAVAHCLTPWLQCFGNRQARSAAQWIEAHSSAAERIAGQGIWQRPEAEALHGFMQEMAVAAGDCGEMDGVSYAAVMEALLATKVVRPEFGAHPRLKILSPLEARMQSFDRVILGGLNEGIWPRQETADPWFNRPMRKAIGLPDMQVQTGQSAHDFVQLASAPEVFLTRSGKAGGSPATASRWWVRLMALLEHAGVADSVLCHRYTHWHRQMVMPQGVTPCPRPAPRPPVSARPVEIAVTQVEKWLEDPYAFYARYVLRLKKLEDVDQDPAAADFGNDVHKALELFMRRYPAALPENPLRDLLTLGRDVFARYDRFYPVVATWWWPRFEQVAEWMIKQETLVRPGIEQVWPEASGRCALGGMTFTGRADRVELLRSGELAVVDYKTGAAHSKKTTKEGGAVQLMLLAWLAQEGTWDATIPRKPLARLEYWVAGGGRKDGEVRPVDNFDAETIATLKENLSVLIAHYTHPDTAYEASAQSVGRFYNDYAHLARAAEWK